MKGVNDWLIQQNIRSKAADLPQILVFAAKILQTDSVRFDLLWNTYCMHPSHNQY